MLAKTPFFDTVKRHCECTLSKRRSHSRVFHAMLNRQRVQYSIFSCYLIYIIFIEYRTFFSFALLPCLPGREAAESSIKPAVRVSMVKRNMIGHLYVPPQATAPLLTTELFLLGMAVGRGWLPPILFSPLFLPPCASA